MTKPTTEVEWAIDSNALKTEPTAKQKTHGWTTSDDTVTGTPPRPVLDNQNYWQNSIGAYIKYVGDISPEGIGETGAIDLWEWDTVNLGQLDDIGGGLRFVDDIQQIGSNLVFKRDQSAQIGNGIAWVNYQPESQYGGMHYEFQDMITRGLGIRLVDGNGVTWTVYNANGKGLDNVGANLASLPLGYLSSGTPTDRSLSFTINVSSTDIAIEKIDEGVVSFPANFNGFASLDETNFDENNPKGVRAVLYGTQTYSSVVNNISKYRRPRRRWIRPAVTSQPTPITAPNLIWPLAWETGLRYSCSFINARSASMVDGTSIVYASTDSSGVIHGYGTSAQDHSVRISFEFTGIFQIANKGIGIAIDGGMSIPPALSPNMDTMYPGIQDGNTLTLEELD